MGAGLGACLALCIAAMVAGAQAQALRTADKNLHEVPTGGRRLLQDPPVKGHALLVRNRCQRPLFLGMMYSFVPRPAAAAIDCEFTSSRGEVGNFTDEAGDAVANACLEMAYRARPGRAGYIGAYDPTARHYWLTAFSTDPASVRPSTVLEERCATYNFTSPCECGQPLCVQWFKVPVTRSEPELRLDCPLDDGTPQAAMIGTIGGLLVGAVLSAYVCRRLASRSRGVALGVPGGHAASTRGVAVQRKDPAFEPMLLQLPSPVPN